MGRVRRSEAKLIHRFDFIMGDEANRKLILISVPALKGPTNLVGVCRNLLKA